MVATRKRTKVYKYSDDSDFVSDEEVHYKKPATKKTASGTKPKPTKKPNKKKALSEASDSSSGYAEQTSSTSNETDDTSSYVSEEEVPTKNSKRSKRSKGESMDESESDTETYSSHSLKRSKAIIPRPKDGPFPDAIAPDTLEFMAELVENNDRDFMRLKQKEWVTARDDFTDFVGLVMKELIEVDPTVKEEEPKQAVYRLNRDLRFTNDKKPYKSYLSASFSRTGKKFADAGYYLSIEPGNKSMAAVGIWQPDKIRRDALRDSLVRHGDLMRECLSTEAIKEVFDGKSGEAVLDKSDMLKVAPAGYPKDHPEIKLLRHKSFVVSKTFTDEEVVSAGFLEKVMDIYEALVPFASVINSWV
ncbi:hypothetical protein BDB01DRAFT_787594 [Pilobolus umbonatus]|nr:hypothetical protein BDB01DRAFT_787594 [Pilobolus umbonatus]